VQHLEEYLHSFGRVEDVMEIVQAVRKGMFWKSLICKYIYIYIYTHTFKETHLNNQVDDKSTLGCTKSFKSIIQHE